MTQRFCIACGKPLGEHDRFCMSCGEPVLLAVPAVPPAPAPVPQTASADHLRPRRW